jgi:hypothetical protein
MSSITFGKQRRRSHAVIGGLVFAVLAAGLLQSGASARSIAGYGPAPATCQLNGYSVACAPAVKKVGTEPASPRAGKGFAVTFKTSSGGTYLIKAKRQGKKKSVTLADGMAGAGTVTIPAVGAGLKAGRYVLKVTITSAGKTKTATDPVKIKKG